MFKSSKLSKASDLLSEPDENKRHTTPTRAQAEHIPLPQFKLIERSYQHQFASMYFLRLAKLKPSVEAAAMEAWDGQEIEGETVHQVERVLDVRQGELCWIAGTIYMEMPLKPSILEDITKDHWIAAPPPRDKYMTPGSDQIMLEDESGRLRLVGGSLAKENLVTGCVVAVMGSETANGDFQVLDVLIPDLPPQRKLESKEKGKGAERGERKKVALVSGLGFRGNFMENFEAEMMTEYLLGEAGGVEEQEDASTVVRLIIAGNSLAAPLALPPIKGQEKTKKYGYDASSYNASPALALDGLLSSLLSSLPVTIIPGASDPANVSLPQQPLHPAIFRNAKHFVDTTFETGTNPYSTDIDGVRFLGTSGQNLDDVYKYIDDDDRLKMCEKLLRWRCIAPTAPDTLWSYPFQDRDQYVIEECPRVFFVGNQKNFETTLIKGPNGQIVRIILIPKFSETKEMVLVDLETLDCETIKFSVNSSI